MMDLFLGGDLAAKDAKILEIKNKLFKDLPDALSFDFDSLDAHKLPEHTLKKSLSQLPVVAPSRLIIVRQAHKLKSTDIQLLLAFCKKPPPCIYLILESCEKVFNDEFKDLSVYAHKTVFAKPEGSTIWDMTRQISAGHCAEALKTLHTFYQNNVHPLQIMRALVWFWGKDGKGLGKERFKKGLFALEEADLNIKRSRMEGPYALEKLVVELGLLCRR